MPVALGIKGYQLYMSCVMSGTEPMLQLEVSRGSHQSVPCRAGAPFHLDPHFIPLAI